jgi:hypothetical protein
LGIDWADVTYRIDDRPLVTDRWWISSDGTNIYKFSAAKELILNLASGNALIARVTPYASAPITGTWNLNGIGSVVDTLGEGCGW